MLPDPKDVEILRSGPRAWNAWRENNPSTVPDLTGIALSLGERQMGPINGGPINLKSARLQGAFLRFATLSTADLEAADMSDADLVHARFDQANLRDANLSNARLDHADLAGATLTKVNLCGASLQHAILSTADLEAADMSDADLMHARFDQANLSAANLTDARLDHADFAGANLSRANLCGASLQHARNLTESQLKESTGSGSTILPPHLRGSVSWSVARSPTEIERHDLSPRAPLPAEADVPHIHDTQRWGIGALFIGVTLVISAFVWQHMNEVVPLDTSGAQRGSESFLAQLKPSLDTGNQGLPPSAPEALMDEKAAAEGQPSADAEIAPSVASTVGQTETTPDQRPAPETDRATVPQETNGKAELQASPGAKPSVEAFGSREHAPGTPIQGDDSALVSAASPPQHAIVPDLPAAAPIPDPQGPPAAEQPADALAVNTPEPSAPVSKAPALPAEAATPELPDPQAAEQPAEALAVNTPEQHLDASPPNYTALPPVTTAPPSVDVTALPHDAEIVPKPVRKPAVQHPAGKPVIQKPTTVPPSDEAFLAPRKRAQIGILERRRMLREGLMSPGFLPPR